MDDFVDLINKCQNHDKIALEVVIRMFHPLIQKNAKRLNYEDAYEEIQCFLVELLQKKTLTANIKNFDKKSILTYLKHSVENYCSNRIKSVIAKRDLQMIPFSALVNERGEYDGAIAWLAHSHDSEDLENTLFMADILTDREIRIIMLYYYHGYTENEIAEIFDITQSAINQVKTRAIKKLRVAYKCLNNV